MYINCFDKYGDLSGNTSLEENLQSKSETPTPASDKPDDDINKLSSTFTVKLSTGNNDANKIDSLKQPQDTNKNNSASS